MDNTFLESLGPIIIAFIVLTYYGLRAMLQPKRPRKSFVEDGAEAKSSRGYRAPEESEFVFSDPLDDSELQERAYDQSAEAAPTSPESYDDDVRLSGSEQSPYNEATARTTPTRDTFNLIEKYLRNVAQKTNDARESRESKTGMQKWPRESRSPAGEGHTPQQVSNVQPRYTSSLEKSPQIEALERPQLSFSASDHATHRANREIDSRSHYQSRAQSLSQQALSSWTNVPVQQQLRVKLRQPEQRRRILKETLFMNEILSKPLALRDPRHTKSP